MRKIFFFIRRTLNITNDFGKKYFKSPSLHQEVYRELIKSFNNRIPTKINQNTLKEGDLDLITGKIFRKENFEKSETEIETYEALAEVNYPQEYISSYPNVIISDKINEKENDPRL